jgi:hypothetical protein
VHRGDATRVLLWNRADLVGIFRVEADGSWTAENVENEAGE